jgi:hypothetical protein
MSGESIGPSLITSTVKGGEEVIIVGDIAHVAVKIVGVATGVAVAWATATSIFSGVGVATGLWGVASGWARGGPPQPARAARVNRVAIKGYILGVICFLLGFWLMLNNYTTHPSHIAVVGGEGGLLEEEGEVDRPRATKTHCIHANLITIREVIWFCRVIIIQSYSGPRGWGLSKAVRPQTKPFV